MNKDKHVLPDDHNTFMDRVRRKVGKQEKSGNTKTIYGPDNETLAEVDVKKER